MPAPPPESEPAMVRTLGIDWVMRFSGGGQQSLRGEARSAAVQMAETTAIPPGPARLTSAALCNWMPPIATVGWSERVHSAARPWTPQAADASGLVGVSNTGPTPT